MINFFVTSKHSYTISWFMSDWASDQLKKNLQIITYDQIPSLQNILPGAFIFSDLERLNIWQLKVIEDFCDQLLDFDETTSIINHPRYVLRRYQLLRKLYDLGFNKFNVYRVSGINSKPQFPLFLRMENDHSGSRTRILEDPMQRDNNLFHAIMSGVDINNLLQIEFCETRDVDGYYRKFSAFRIGDEIIPAHIIYDKIWHAKDGETPDNMRNEENKYISENPHADKILEIFTIAEINFGRIDYGLLDGNIQTWEINTNPILNFPRKKYLKETIPGKQKLAEQLEKGLLAINFAKSNVCTSIPKHKISLKWNIDKYI